jgi:hypothetical protein
MNIHNIFLVKTISIKNALKDWLDLSGNRLLRKNKSLKNFYTNKRVFLICSGSSINYIDLSLLKNEETMCVGHFYHDETVAPLEPKMFLLGETYKNIDKNERIYALKLKNPLHDKYKIPNFLAKHSDFLRDQENRKLWYCNQIDRSFMAGSKIFATAEDHSFIHQNGLYKDKQIVYTKYSSVSSKKKFTLDDFDLTKRMYAFNAGSVACALMSLMHLGFKDIFLVGAGYTMSPRLVLHYYDNYVFPSELGFERSKQLAEAIALDHNKIYKSSMYLYNMYEANGLYHAQFVEEFKEDQNSSAHEQISSFAKANNIRIRNIVPAGFESPIYEKATWENVKDLMRYS